MKTYIQTQKDLLLEWQKEAEAAYLKVYGEDEEFDNKRFAEFKNVLNDIMTGVNKLSMTAIKEAASSDEAKTLDAEYSGTTSGGFSEFIQNSILNLFK